MSYVYIQSEPPGVDSDGLYTVGFYAPDGTWEPESDHGKRERAPMLRERARENVEREWGL